MAVPMVIYKSKPKNHSWCRWMNARMIRKNSNNLIAVVGRPGSGKTWQAISTAQIMSKMSGASFCADNIVFTLKDLMRLINSGNISKGSVIIFDEPQISIGAKDFQSTANKVFNMLVSTFRHRNFTLFFCTPFETLLDKSTRRLFTARFEMISIDQNKNTSRCKPRFVEYSDHKSTPYVKQMIVCYKTPDGLKKAEKLFYWDVPKPTDDIIESYEKKKLLFTSNLNRNIMRKLEAFDDSGKSMTSEATPDEEQQRKPLTEAQERVMRCLAKGITQKKAAEELGCVGSVISDHKKYAMKKGYTLGEFADGE